MAPPGSGAPAATYCTARGGNAGCCRVLPNSPLETFGPHGHSPAARPRERGHVPESLPKLDQLGRAALRCIWQGGMNAPGFSPAHPRADTPEKVRCGRAAPCSLGSRTLPSLGGTASFTSLQKAWEHPQGAPSQPRLPTTPRDVRGSVLGHTTLLLQLQPGPEQGPGLAAAVLGTGSCTSAAAVPWEV